MLLLNLFLSDKFKGNLAYLARPCQWLEQKPSSCQPKYWTSLRYSPEVISSLNHALDVLKQGSQAESLELIGYSGGGTVALLLAARRQDVNSLRTIAGNLANSFFTRYHGVSDMPKSLDPVDFVAQLQSLPQLHFVGGADDVIPVEVAEYYHSKLASPHCAQYRVLSSVSHSSGWLELWPKLLSQSLPCSK